MQDKKMKVGIFSGMNYYSEKLNQGLEYQDYITEQLYKCGLPLINYSSKKYQFTKGENILGVEIKFDDKYDKTGNLYIEVAERSNINKNYVTSGIFRNDNTWLYIQGNYNIAFIFFKTQLQLLSRKLPIFEISLKTSKGFLLKNDMINKYCGKKLFLKNK